jgi:hypothetical protein
MRSSLTSTTARNRKVTWWKTSRFLLLTLSYYLLFRAFARFITKSGDASDGGFSTGDATIAAYSV